MRDESTGVLWVFCIGSDECDEVGDEVASNFLVARGFGMS
jgi:hypothetical protein